MGITERRQREKENLRQVILDGARELFAKDGYENVTMRKIAEKVEYTPGTIYLYFRDKAELLNTICDETFTRLSQQLQELIEQRHQDPLTTLRQGLRTYIYFGLAHPSDYILTFIMAGKSQLQVEFDPASAGPQCFDKLRQVVIQCVAANLLLNNDAETLSQTLWAGIHGITSLLIMHTCFPFVERDKLIEQMLDMLMNGVTKRSEFLEQKL